MADASGRAARLTDPIGHGLGMVGMIGGALLGAAVGAFMIVTLPVSAPLLVGALVGTAAVGAVAGGALAGDQLMHGIQTAFSIPDPTTGAIGMVGSPNVFIGGLPAARAVVDMAATCNGLFSTNHLPLPAFGPPAPIAEGSATVLINGMHAARVGSKLVCGAVITDGCSTVIIGGPTVRLLTVDDLEAEMQQFFGNILKASLLAAGLITFLMGGEALLGFAALFGGFTVVNGALGMLGNAIGPGWSDILQGTFGLTAIVAGAKLGGGEDPTAIEERTACGEPVDPTTGEVFTSTTDFELPGALPLAFKRGYASSLNQQSWLGPNWCCSWGQSVQVTEAGAVRYFPGDSQSLNFQLSEADAEGWVRSSKSKKLRLRQTPNGFQVFNRENHLVSFTEARENAWLLGTIQDLNGNFIRFHYEQGTLQGVEHSGGYRLHVTATATHIAAIALEQFDGTLQTIVRYEYDGGGRLGGVDNGSGKLLRYEYDQDARMVSWRDRECTWYRYRYDAEGRCVESGGAGGRYHYYYTYDPANRTTVAMDSYGGTESFHYNQRNQVIVQHDAVGGVTHTSWDERGNKVSVIDSEGRGVAYVYDAEGDLTSSTDALGRTTKLELNYLGLPVLMTDASGRRWVRRYDLRGNLLEAGPEGKAAWRYERDGSGNLVRIVDPNGRSRAFGYNGAGLPMWVTDWQGNRTRYTRDAFGRVVRETDPLDSDTRYAYNAIRKLSQLTQSNGTQTLWQYDAEGNLIARTAQDGATYRYAYGPFDVRQSITRPSGATLRFHHDLQTRLTAVENERGELWEYTYDLGGRVTGERDFTGRKQGFAYDRSSLAIRRINARGEVTTIDRNHAGQIAKVETWDGAETTYAYDANGLIVEATNQWIAVKIERDEYGRVLREVQGDRMIESIYDERGLRTRRRTSEGQETRWSYDDNGRVEQIGLPGDEWMDFSYDAMGRNRERRFHKGAASVYGRRSEGLVLRQGYDPLHRLTAQWAGLGAGATGEAVALAERQYRYDLNDNPTEIYDRFWGTAQYTYNPDGRIATARRERELSEGFQYDESGNISAVVSVESDGRAESRSLGGPALERRKLGPGGRLELAGNLIYAYDDEGRVVRKRDLTPGRPERTWEFSWTSDSRLRSVHNPLNERWTYEYDAFGRRARKIGPESSTTYVWDGDVVADEIHETRTAFTTQSWIYEPGSFRPLAAMRNEGSYACVIDQVGTPRELVSSAGKLAWSAQLTTWGELRSAPTATIDCPLRFQGQWFDEESGLHYNYKRYYDPETASYLTPDSLGMDGGARSYGYVHNPTAWIDPFGLASCTTPPKASGTLDWSRTNPRTGETAPDHVMKHGDDIPTRPGPHGVFADDPIATTNAAWDTAVQQGIQPTVQPNGNWSYDVPSPEAGLGGGVPGNAAGNPVLNKVQVVTQPNTNNTVVTSFPK